MRRVSARGAGGAGTRGRGRSLGQAAAAAQSDSFTGETAQPARHAPPYSSWYGGLPPPPRPPRDRLRRLRSAPAPPRRPHRGSLAAAPGTERGEVGGRLADAPERAPAGRLLAFSLVSVFQT